MRPWYRLRASEVIPSPLPPRQHFFPSPPSLCHVLLHPHCLFIPTPFPGPAQLVSGLMHGFVEPGKPLNRGDSPSILLASCEPGLHDSSSLCLPLLFENGGDQRADVPGFVPTPRASPPYIPSDIHSHVYSHPSPNRLSLVFLCRSMAHLRDIHLTSYILRTYSRSSSLPCAPIPAHLTCPPC